MKFHTSFLPLLLAIGLSAPAQANETDTYTLLNLIKNSGTNVSFNSNHFDKDCIGNAGYYSYVDKQIDLLVVCTDQTDADDPEKLWETVAHEATHIMQACTGSTAFTADNHPTMFRTLSTRAPHYSAKLDSGYHSGSALTEAEAFWMELQPPSHVITYFKQVCVD